MRESVMHRMRIPRPFALAFVVCFLSICGFGDGGSEVVWQIGKFDQSPSGFNGNFDFAEPGHRFV
jgi:hypothetical protein